MDKLRHVKVTELKEGTTRGLIKDGVSRLKDGVSRPVTTQSARPIAPPPPPKKK